MLQEPRNVQILTDSGESSEANNPTPEQMIGQANQDMMQMHPYERLFTAESGLKYPEMPSDDPPGRIPMDTTTMNVELKFPQADLLSPQDFALIRRDGFGGSDSSVLLGVNPYTNRGEMIRQKCLPNLTQEELETGEQTAVIKGNDLEPLIIEKFQRFFGMKTFKPTDMYRFKEHPYLTMNFDGVTGDEKQYIPVEIKVVTKKGERHYNPAKAIFVEGMGHKVLPQNYAATQNSWGTKAAMYGIPPYYYTQLQQEMFACNAPFGFLCVMFEASWKVHCFFAHKDQSCWNNLVIEGFKAWEQVQQIRRQKGLPEVFWQGENHAEPEAE